VILKSCSTLQPDVKMRVGSTCNRNIATWDIGFGSTDEERREGEVRG
jgi:hypothetical protein